MEKEVKIYVLIDAESPHKDCVVSVHTTREQAEKSEKELKDMCVGGRDTYIIESHLNLSNDSKRGPEAYENLRLLVHGWSINAYQKTLAIKEFDNLINQ